jgi:hypothetical protein
MIKSQRVSGRKRAVAEPDRSTGDAPVYCHDQRTAALSLPDGTEFELKPGLNFVPRDYWDRWQAQHAEPTAATVFEIGPRPNEPDWVRDNKSGAQISKDAAIARYLKPLGDGRCGDAWDQLREDIDAAADPDATERLLDAFATAQRLAAQGAAICGK